MVHCVENVVEPGPKEATAGICVFKAPQCTKNFLFSICKGCYDDDDYDEAMMECAHCGGWIHAKCEGIDGEQYQVLSLLPDTVEYVCK